MTAAGNEIIVVSLEKQYIHPWCQKFWKLFEKLFGRKKLSYLRACA